MTDIETDLQRERLGGLLRAYPELLRQANRVGIFDISKATLEQLNRLEKEIMK